MMEKRGTLAAASDHRCPRASARPPTQIEAVCTCAAWAITAPTPATLA